MISVSTLMHAIVYLVIAGLFFWLAWWLLGKIDPPQPFRKVAEVLIAVLAFLVCAGILLSLVGGTPVFRP